MKKVLYGIIGVLILFCCSFKINAEEYACQYYNEEGHHTGLLDVQVDRYFKYIVDTDKKTIVSEPVGSSLNGKLDVISDYIADSSKDEAYYADFLKGKCQSSIYVCKYLRGTDTIFGVLFNDTYREKILNTTLYLEKVDDKNYIFSSENKCWKFLRDKGISINPQASDYCKKFTINDKTNDCKKFDFSDENYDKKGESVDIKYTCDYYENTKEELKTLVDEYKSCINNGGSCGKQATDHSLKLEKIKEYCKNVMAHQNYGDSCMTDCLNLKNEKDILLAETDVTIKCSLTEDIIAMIYNVLKWIKYILPALVIILTMLDFIKAIAAQNDDDMKKAQGKFIKRLIVAALLFLLPLIINFILQTFGFYNSGCDITDLL